jgi:hypothetical protein
MSHILAICHFHLIFSPAAQISDEEHVVELLLYHLLHHITSYHLLLNILDCSSSRVRYVAHGICKITVSS